jgi:hypothetical protein
MTLGSIWMEFGVIYEAKLRPSTWMMFRLQTIRMEMNWDELGQI